MRGPQPAAARGGAAAGRGARLLAKAADKHAHVVGSTA